MGNPSLRLELREVQPRSIEYAAEIGGELRPVSVAVFGERSVMFPHPLCEAGESLGSEELDECVRRRARFIVALRRELRR